VLKKQIFRFIVTGVINTIFGYSLYALFIYIGFKYHIALLFATILGILFNYKTIGKFVFNNKEKNTIIKFFIVYIIVFIINIVLIKFFKLFNFNDYLAGFIAVIPASTISFILNKYYVFKEIKK
jgi:putative flippase GtrA